MSLLFKQPHRYCYSSVHALGVTQVGSFNYSIAIALCKLSDRYHPISLDPLGSHA
jgi:hypothetical protein